MTAFAEPVTVLKRLEVAGLLLAFVVLGGILYPSEYTRGLMHREEGDRSRAIAFFTGYLKLHPDHKDATLALAQAYEEAGRPEPAIPVLLTLYRRRRGDLETGRLLLDLYDRADEPAQAEAFLWELVADLRTLPSPPARAIEGLLYDAFQRASARQDDATGLKALAMLSTTAADGSSYRGEMLRLLMERRKLDAAVYLLRAAARREPLNVELKRTLARVFILKKDFAKARVELDLAARLKPADIGVLMDRAELFAKEGRPDLAEGEYRRLMALQPRESSWPQQLGSSLIKRGRFREGVRVYESLLERDPGDRQTWMTIVYAYSDKGEHLEAARRLEAYLKRYPSDSEAVGLLIFEYQSAGLVDRAIALQRKDVAAHPRDPKRRVDLAWRLIDEERFAEAEEQFKAAVALDPDSSENWQALVWAQGLQKKLPDMARTLEGYLARFPGDGKIVERLADYYVRLGRREDAIALLRGYLKPRLGAAPEGKAP